LGDNYPETHRYWTDLDAMAAALVAGPLLEAAAIELADTGAVWTLAASADIAGTYGVPAVRGTSPAITFTGPPLDDYALLVTVVAGGPIGTATFTYSLDGGATVSRPITTAPSYPIAANGVTIDFAPGTYVAGDSVSVACAAPFMTAAELGRCANALVAYLLQTPSFAFGTGHIVGLPHGDTDAARAAGALGTAVAADALASMLAADSIGLYVRIGIDGADATDAALIAAFGNFESPLVLVGGGMHDVVSPLTKRVHRRPVLWSYTPRIAQIPIHKHPGEVARGPLPSRIRRLSISDPTQLDANRFVTLRQFSQLPGVYITRGPTMAAPDSDYSEHQRCRVVDRTSQVGRLALLRQLNRDLDVKADGSLTDVQADRIDNALQRPLADALLRSDPPATDGVSAKVKRTNDVVATSTLIGQFRVKPKGYAEFISWETGFTPLAPAGG
jgi:hypothetical protein